jgi:aspartyl protease family protein
MVNAFVALLWWFLILTGLVGAYTYRAEVQEVASRIYAEVVPGSTASTGRPGEVTVAGSARGFLVEGSVNGAATRFVFDTGASAVVLRPETARAAGIDPARLTYDVTVTTANGQTRAARVSIARLAIGEIVERDVMALIARPGDLSVDLLGMTFLQRLDYYGVTGGRLILRGRTA